MKTLNANDLTPLQLQNYLQYVIAPRPIALISTIDSQGNVNLSPFSFFNLFSTNPPLCVFSPSRRVRDNTVKHTLQNLEEVPECVIHIVTPAILHQTSLSSTEYAKEHNEFVKAGFTPIKSYLVKPPRVAESPVHMECIVTQIIAVGDGPGAGNLVFAEIKYIHIDENLLTSDSSGIDQQKVELVARLGGDWYCQVTTKDLFKVPKPVTGFGIGIDQLPDYISNSEFLSKNDLAQLANIQQLPTNKDAAEFCRNNPEIALCLNNDPKKEFYTFQKARELINKHQLLNAWYLLIALKF